MNEGVFHTFAFGKYGNKIIKQRKKRYLHTAMILSDYYKALEK